MKRHWWVLPGLISLCVVLLVVPFASGRAINTNEAIIGVRNYCAPVTASGTTYACSITGAPSNFALVAGGRYSFLADVVNTGSATINFSSLGAKTIKKKGGTNLLAGEICASQMIDLMYDGTNMQMLTPPCIVPRGIAFSIGDPGGSTLTVAATTTDYVTVPFACTISAYNLAIDAGTITVKFWKVATGTAIPTSSNSISTSGVSIASGTAIHSTTVSDFTSTAVAANDIMAMNVTAVATAKYVSGVLQCDY